MSKSAYYIAFDTETGGLNPELNPVLTAYFAVLTKDLEIIDELDLVIKPDSKYTVDAEALAVNNLNLEKDIINNPMAKDRVQASIALVSFLKKNQALVQGRDKRLRPFGHNVSFDETMIEKQFLGKTFKDFFHYNKTDTMAVVNFLKDVGWLDSKLGKLTTLVEHFECRIGDSHNAKNDTLMTIEVYKKLKQMMFQNNTGLSTGSVIELIES